MAPTDERIEQRVRERFPGLHYVPERGPAMRESSAHVAAEGLVELCTFLRDDPELDFAMLSWISGVDWLPRTPRFEVVYGLLSVTHARRLQLKVRLNDELPRVPTLTGVWRGADWLERETYDLYGIEFAGHPDLRRILMPEDWVGWPLRKDSPLGYEEVAFTHNTPGRTVPHPELRKLAPKKVRYRAQ